MVVEGVWGCMCVWCWVVFGGCVCDGGIVWGCVCGGGECLGMCVCDGGGVLGRCVCVVQDGFGGMCV